MNGALIRVYTTAGPTLGLFSVTNDAGIVLNLRTLELPWLNNEPDKSCIPEGTFIMIRHSSPAHPNVWQVSNVPGRSEILVHNGNVEQDSLGCIIVGLMDGTLNGEQAVLQSDTALDALMQFTSAWTDGWPLIITH